jgi:DNA-binding transcriptional LysR family regulator
MRITLAQLEAFYWVAQLGSVQLAARQLNLAQPTISLRIRDLEHNLGRDLFERNGRGVRPSDAGSKLLKRAAAILDEVGKIKTVAAVDVDVTGSIRIGFAEGFAVVCLAPLVELLRKNCPGLRPELFVATSSALERELAAHRLDLAFLVNPIGQPGLRMQPLGAQPNGWVASRKLGIGPRIRPAEARLLPIVSNPPPSAMYRQITEWFATAGLEPARVDMCTSVTLVAHLVTAGVGIGLLPLKMIEAQLASGALQILDSTPGVEPGRVFATFWEGGQTPAVDAVVHCVRQVLGEMDYLVLAA